MLKELYIVRHGHPLQGTGLTYDRVPGPALSDVGRAEAQVSALFLEHRDIEITYTSPLERTLGTARIIVAAINVPLVIEPALAEHRSDETFEEVKARIRDMLARLDSQPHDIVALVTHGSPMKALLKILSLETIDLSRYSFSNGNNAPTAGIWHAQRDLFGVWQLTLAFKPVVATPAAHVAI
jgi:2,3-bisphosphoglycerate-dependent phosphoglycerate mutase